MPRCKSTRSPPLASCLPLTTSWLDLIVILSWSSVDSALNFFKPKKERMIKNRLSVPRLFLLVSEPVQTNWGPQQHSNDIDAGCLGDDLKISQITCVAAGLE
jgi:hypothetical protein